MYKPQMKQEVYDWCSGAKKGCVECKRCLVDVLKEFIVPKREEKKKILKKKDYIRDILNEGAKKAKVRASQTLEEVKKAMKVA